MGADNRTCMRVPYSVSAVCCGQGTRREVKCETTDISLEGAFLSGPVTPFGPEALVELKLWLEYDGIGREYTLPAKVVRVTSEGAGVVFRGLDIGAYSALLGQLYNICCQDKKTAVA